MDSTVQTHADSAAPQLDQSALERWLATHGWTKDSAGRYCAERPGLSWQRSRTQAYRIVFAPAGVRVEAKEPDVKGIRLPWFRVSYGVWGRTVVAAPGAVRIGQATVLGERPQPG